MKKVYFEDLAQIASVMIDKARSGKSISAVLFYDEATELTQQLLRDDDVAIHLLNLSPVDWGGYNKEYYVTLNDDLTLFVEPAFCETYYVTMSDIMLFDGDASSMIYHCNSDDTTEFIEICYNECEDDDYDFYGEEDYVDDEEFICPKCQGCCEKCEDDDDVTFRVTVAKPYVSEFLDILQAFCYFV